MGFGAVVLLMWRTLRQAGKPIPTGQPVAAPAAI
jgi:hypothetical protein